MSAASTSTLSAVDEWSKANDLIVARRQKRPGMQWILETSAALAALRSLMLNGGWERHWQQREVLPLVAS